MSMPSPTLSRLPGIVLFCFLVLVAASAVPTLAQAAAPAWRIIAVSGPTNLPPNSDEIQQVAVDATGGSFTLRFGGQETAQIAADASDSALEVALDSLTTIGGVGGSVRVVGGPGDSGATDPYAISFSGTLAETDLEQISADGAELVGGAETAVVTTAVDGGAGKGTIAVYVQNLGGAPSAGRTDVTIQLPTGIAGSTTSPGKEWTCTEAEPVPRPGLLSCESEESVAPGSDFFPIKVPVAVGRGAPASSTVTVTVAGGGTLGTVSYEEPLTVSTNPASAGIAAFQAGSFDADGELFTQAGGHPASASAALFVNTRLSPRGAVVPAGDPREIEVALPPGFIGNPLAAPRCPIAFADVSAAGCTEDTTVGVAIAITQAFGTGDPQHAVGVHDDEPRAGYPAAFAFVATNEQINLVGGLRSDTDYGVSVLAPNTPQIAPVYGALFTFCNAGAKLNGILASCREATEPEADADAFLTNPVNCSEEMQTPPLVGLGVDSWQAPGAFSRSSVTLPSVSGCDQLASRFRPSFSFRPQGQEAAAPAAFTARLTIPQEGLVEPEGLVAPELKKAVVALPKGVNVNPSSANGLQACSETQMGLTTTSGAAPNPIRFDKSEPACPDASKLGTVEARSPLLEETLEGTIYLAAQEENPFHSLLAIYAVIDSPKNGIIVKLPGEVKPDLTTGQLTATFDNNPQLPVEDLKLNFRGGGPRSPLATPPVCGTYTTHGELTPWSAPESGPPAQTADSFAVTGGPGGGACASSEAGLPFTPSFEAGTTSTQAGAYAPLVIKLGRKDGEQELTHLNFTLPPGLTGRLAGIPYCPDSAIAAAGGKSGKAEQASPSCPAASELGTVDTSAGVGSEPIHVGGHVYLAGPYEGAPLSAVVITPAVAGPFDLGDVVVRAALRVNPETAQITAQSDEIPHILRGIPLQLRSVEIKVSRSGFTLNPTSCEPMALTSSIGGLNGATAKPANRFQVGGCQNLAFKPNLKVRLKGATGRTGHPALKAVLTAKPGEANIARAQVNLPHGEFLDQGNLNRTCTKPVLLAGDCPKSTIYGRAKAWSPLLAQPLQGYVYLVGGYGYKLPALVADLNGQIRVTLAGKVDSGPNHGIRNTFEVVPDAPVSRFVLEMKGGKKYGLLVNSEPLCQASKADRRAIVRFTGQNNKVKQFKPVVANQCGKGKKRKHSRKHSKHANKRADAQRLMAAFPGPFGL